MEQILDGPVLAEGSPRPVAADRVLASRQCGFRYGKKADDQRCVQKKPLLAGHCSKSEVADHRGEGAGPGFKAPYGKLIIRRHVPVILQRGDSSAPLSFGRRISCKRM